MTLSWSKRQLEVLALGREGNPTLLVQGVPNSGKTAATLGAFHLWSLSYENQLFGVCAKNFKLVENVIMRETREFCRHYRLPFRNSVPGLADAYGIGSNTYVKLSASNVGMKENVQSYSFVGLYVDEVVNVNKEVFYELENRVRGAPGAKLWMTRNMVGMQHWFKRAYVDRADVHNMRTVQLEFADNPAVDAAFIRRMRLSQGGLYQRRFLGVDADLTGRVFPAYYEPEEAPKKQGAAAWYVSVDPSESGTTHALLFGLFDGAWWVFDELVMDTGEMESVTHREQARAMLDWLDGWQVSPMAIICDDASPNFMEELRRAGGERKGHCPVWPAQKSVADGIALTQSVLAEGKLRLSNRLPKLMTEIGSYVWDEKAQAEGLDKPVKFADHGVDALRYFAYTVGSIAA